MLTLEFSFPSGRYHGTPWGRHVNEAAVGWPPDPWRLCRALIATWHRKLPPGKYPREHLVDLLEALAGSPPLYHLPEAVHFHSRHYMPIRGGKTTLVFDAFAQVGPEARLGMHWPDLELAPVTQSLLAELLWHLPYLGRAESWVEARLAREAPRVCNCVPCSAAVNTDGGERVTLWRPRTARDYLHFRRQTLAGPALEGQKARQRKQLEASLPEDWLAALSLDTADLQAAGWSAPPAAFTQDYLRPTQSLAAAARRPRATLPSSDKPVPTTARYALYATPRPLRVDTVQVAERLRSACMGRARRLLGEVLPPSLSGHLLAPGTNHRHAFYLPEDQDGDGRLDHLLIHAPGGLEPEACRTLTGLEKVYGREEPEWTLLLEGLGTVEDLAATGSSLLGRSLRWRSCTPWLHPWHTRRNLGLLDQLQRESFPENF